MSEETLREVCADLTTEYLKKLKSFSLYMECDFSDILEMCIAVQYEYLKRVIRND